jgi:hypothetical protein
LEEGKTKCLGKSKGRKYPPMDSNVSIELKKYKLNVQNDKITYIFLEK